MFKSYSSSIILTFALFATVASAQSLNSVDTLEVVDSTGARVARVQGPESPMFFEFDGRIFQLNLDAPGILGVDVMYLLTGCNTDPYLSDLSGDIPPTAGFREGWVYFRDTSVAAQNLTIKSVWHEFSQTCDNFEFDTMALPADPVLNLSGLNGLFVPPFSVQPEGTSKSKGAK